MAPTVRPEARICRNSAMLPTTCEPARDTSPREVDLRRQAQAGRGVKARQSQTDTPLPIPPPQGGGRRLGTARTKLHSPPKLAADQYSSFHLPLSISTMWNSEVSSPMWSVADRLKTPSTPTTFVRFSMASRTLALSVEPASLTAVT